jgi:long-chain acyl-CoA synthetase
MQMTTAFKDLPALIADHARQRPEALAVVVGDEAQSYAALDTVMDRVAATLQQNGAGPGQVIALCAASSVAYLAVWGGALRAGLAVAPLAPGATAAQLAGMAHDAGACWGGHRPVAWPFNIIYSSGTTGTPKGIVQSTPCAGRTCAARWPHPVGLRPDRRITLLATPLYSNTTLVCDSPRWPTAAAWC